MEMKNQQARGFQVLWRNQPVPPLEEQTRSWADGTNKTRVSRQGGLQPPAGRSQGLSQSHLGILWEEARRREEGAGWGRWAHLLSSRGRQRGIVWVSRGYFVVPLGDGGLLQNQHSREVQRSGLPGHTAEAQELAGSLPA